MGKLLNLWTDKDGYVRASVRTAAGFKHVPVSRLVAYAFHGETPSPDHVAAHGNGIRSDNREGNIRWATDEENFSDRYAHETDPTGERNPRAKLTEEDVNIIRSRLMFGETIASVARLFFVTETTIRNIKLGRLWKHLEFQL